MGEIPASAVTHGCIPAHTPHYTQRNRKGASEFSGLDCFFSCHSFLLIPIFFGWRRRRRGAVAFFFCPVLFLSRLAASSLLFYPGRRIDVATHSKRREMEERERGRKTKNTIKKHDDDGCDERIRGTETNHDRRKRERGGVFFGTIADWGRGVLFNYHTHRVRAGTTLRWAGKARQGWMGRVETAGLGGWWAVVAITSCHQPAWLDDAVPSVRGK